MKKNQHIIPLVAGLLLIFLSSMMATSLDEQTALVAQRQEQIKELEKLSPEHLDKALTVLAIEDPLITKAVLRYRSATAEKDAAFDILRKTHAMILESWRAKLWIERRELEKLKASK